MSFVWPAENMELMRVEKARAEKARGISFERNFKAEHYLYASLFDNASSHARNHIGRLKPEADIFGSVNVGRK